jgi:hypothetical protein
MGDRQQPDRQQARRCKANDGVELVLSRPHFAHTIAQPGSSQSVPPVTRARERGLLLDLAARRHFFSMVRIVHVFVRL